jgi:hypothetical protein
MAESGRVQPNQLASPTAWLVAARYAWQKCRYLESISIGAADLGVCVVEVSSMQRLAAGALLAEGA